MVFVASPDYKKFIIIGAAGVAAVALLIFLIVSSGGGDGGFRSERILAWLDPEGHSQGKGFQTLQALYAIGSGGIFGKGLGQSMQKLSFIPESSSIASKMSLAWNAVASRTALQMWALVT